MRSSLIGLVLSLTVLACRPSTPPSNQPSSTNTTELHINPFVDTLTDSNSLLILQNLQHFLQTKNAAATQNEYWDNADFERYVYPYNDIFRIEEGKWQPNLLEIIPLQKDSLYQVKLAYMQTNKLRFIYNFLAEGSSKMGFKFKRILAYQTHDWQEKKVGAIQYKITPSHTFKRKNAKKLHVFNKRVAKFFDTSPIEFTYYLCLSPAELFQIRGFDYHPMMYKYPTGGQNETWTHTIYAGNDSEWYPHELVHSYTAKLYGKTIPRLFDEGIATYLGGSNEMTLGKHLTNLKNYLDNHPKADIMQMIWENKRIGTDGETAVLYAVGGLFCEAAIEKAGKKGLETLFEAGKEQEACLAAIGEVFELSPSDIPAFIKQQLADVTQ